MQSRVSLLLVDLKSPNFYCRHLKECSVGALVNFFLVNTFHRWMEESPIFIPGLKPNTKVDLGDNKITELSEDVFGPVLHIFSRGDGAKGFICSVRS